MQHRLVEITEVRGDNEDLLSGEYATEVHIAGQTQEYCRSGYDVEAEQNASNVQNTTDGCQLLSANGNIGTFPSEEIAVLFYLAYLRMMSTTLANECSHAYILII